MDFVRGIEMSWGGIPLRLDWRGTYAACLERNEAPYVPVSPFPVVDAIRPDNGFDGAPYFLETYEGTGSPKGIFQLSLEASDPLCSLEVVFGERPQDKAFWFLRVINGMFQSSSISAQGEGSAPPSLDMLGRALRDAVTVHACREEWNRYGVWLCLIMSWRATVLPDVSIVYHDPRLQNHPTAGEFEDFLQGILRKV